MTLIPSIDLQSGSAVQLEKGKELKINAGPPFELAQQFKLAGEIAVIDLDAAMSKGDNKETINKLIQIAPCRVGGGIRDLETAKYWLNQGASKIIIGTKAEPELLSKLPKDRLIAAVDAYNGEVVVEGWTKKTSSMLHDKVKELRDYVGGFLITFVEREGMMTGMDIDHVKKLVEIASPAKVTVAGGIKTAQEIGQIHHLGADSQVGMALYSGKISLEDAIISPLKFENELAPTVVVDEFGVALGLAYSSKDSLKEAIKQKKGIYQSRKRGLWLKGQTSGATQDLLKVDLDCDADTVRFTVKQHGEGFCHLDQYSCWGENLNFLSVLEQTISSRLSSSSQTKSYTQRLLKEEGLLDSKISEEANELVDASDKDEILWEAADLLYFSLVKLKKHGSSLKDLSNELKRRHLTVTRKPGNAKK